MSTTPKGYHIWQLAKLEMGDPLPTPTAMINAMINAILELSERLDKLENEKKLTNTTKLL